METTIRLTHMLQINTRMIVQMNHEHKGNRFKCSAIVDFKSGLLGYGRKMIYDNKGPQKIDYLSIALVN